MPISAFLFLLYLPSLQGGVLVEVGRSALMSLKAILNSIMSLFRPNNKTSTCTIVINNLEVHVYLDKE